MPFGLNGLRLIDDTFSNCSWAFVYKNSSLSFEVINLLLLCESYFTFNLYSDIFGISCPSSITEVFCIIFWNSYSFKAPMINCLRFFKLSPIVLVEVISWLLSLGITAMLIKPKHLDAARFKSLIIFHEYLML